MPRAAFLTGIKTSAAARSLRRCTPQPARRWKITMCPMNRQTSAPFQRSFYLIAQMPTVHLLAPRICPWFPVIHPSGVSYPNTTAKVIRASSVSRVQGLVALGVKNLLWFNWTRLTTCTSVQVVSRSRFQEHVLMNNAGNALKSPCGKLGRSRSFLFALKTTRV